MAFQNKSEKEKRMEKYMEEILSKNRPSLADSQLSERSEDIPDNRPRANFDPKRTAPQHPADSTGSFNKIMTSEDEYNQIPVDQASSNSYSSAAQYQTKFGNQKFGARPLPTGEALNQPWPANALASPKKNFNLDDDDDICMSYNKDSSAKKSRGGYSDRLDQVDHHQGVEYRTNRKAEYPEHQQRDYVFSKKPAQPSGYKQEASKHDSHTTLPPKIDQAFGQARGAKDQQTMAQLLSPDGPAVRLPHSRAISDVNPLDSRVNHPEYSMDDTSNGRYLGHPSTHQNRPPSSTLINERPAVHTPNRDHQDLAHHQQHGQYSRQQPQRPEHTDHSRQQHDHQQQQNHQLDEQRDHRTADIGRSGVQSDAASAKTIVESLVHLKAQTAGDTRGKPSFESAISRFQGLLLSHSSPLSPEDLAAVAVVFSQYQTHCKKLESSLALSNRELRIAQTELKALQDEKRGPAGPDKRHAVMMERIQAMADESDRLAAQAKRNELMAAERLSQAQNDAERAATDAARYKAEADRMAMQKKEVEMELDRISYQYKVLLNKFEILSQEKDDYQIKAGSLAEKLNKIEYNQTGEAERLRAENLRYQQSAQELIEEVCKHKLRWKELEVENQTLKELQSISRGPRIGVLATNQPLGSIDFQKNHYSDLKSGYSLDRDSMNIKPLFSPQSQAKNPDFNDFNFPNDADNMYTQDMGQLDRPFSSITGQATDKNPYTLDKQSVLPPKQLPPRPQSGLSAVRTSQNQGVLVENPSKAAHPDHLPPAGVARSNESGLGPSITGSRRGSSVSINPPHSIAAETGSTVTNSNVGGGSARRLPITSFPAHSKLEENDGLIRQLETELSEQQHERAELSAQLCRLPERPRTQADREKKDQIENKLDAVEKRIGEIKRTLKGASKY